MSDNLSVVVNLQKRVEAAKTQRAKSQAELDRCEADLAAAKDALSEFGVETAEEAAALLKELQQAFDTELASIEEGLTDLES